MAELSILNECDHKQNIKQINEITLQSIN